MSSRYSEKHRGAATCTGRNCSEQATKLLLMSGKPWWLCDDCYAELSATNTGASR